MTKLRVGRRLAGSDELPHTNKVFTGVLFGIRVTRLTR